MTHHTDTERAEFEAWALINMATYRTPEWMLLKNKSGEYAHFDVNLVWSAWQAARRAPVVPVPQGYEYDMIDRFLRNNLHDDDYAEYSAALDELAAAPQPPEAAPVQFPEPVGCTTKPWGVAWNTSQIEAGTRLYTEHQVSAILAQHGIKTK